MKQYSKRKEKMLSNINFKENKNQMYYNKRRGNRCWSDAISPVL